MSKDTWMTMDSMQQVMYDPKVKLQLCTRHLSVMSEVDAPAYRDQVVLRRATGH